MTVPGNSGKEMLGGGRGEERLPASPRCADRRRRVETATGSPPAGKGPRAAW